MTAEMGVTHRLPTSSDVPTTPPTGAPVDVAALGRALTEAVSGIVAGAEPTVTTAIACLLSGGHLLIEDIPGVGKTLLAQSLAGSIGGTFHRIQGTPDLLPGDVTGAMVPHGDGFDFEFRAGPIFANVVVFDELNRANPRTQAALLEATEEAAVTIDGETRSLPQPFMLVATQNPNDMAGTYPLGEGALDRFAAVVSPGRADRESEIEVLTGRRGRTNLAELRAVADANAVQAARKVVDSVHVADGVAAYVVDVLEATRRHPGVSQGASTRAGVSLVGLARARAALEGRDYVVPDDVSTLAVPALAHRIIGERSGGSIDVGRRVIEECVARVPAPGV